MANINLIYGQACCIIQCTITLTLELVFNLSYHILVVIEFIEIAIPFYKTENVKKNTVSFNIILCYKCTKAPSTKNRLSLTCYPLYFFYYPN